MRACALVASLLMLLVLISCSGGDEAREVKGQASTRPNILFILTDDQTPEDLAAMGKVKTLLSERGMTFDNAFATTPTCCPSRTSFMRGQYAHNHGVLTNNGTTHGSYEVFRVLDLERSTVASWLNGAGYDTFYAGKFLNRYPTEPHVPAGWDKWYAFAGELSMTPEYTVNENGTLKTYRQSEMDDTRYLTSRATSFIRNHSGSGPWFAWVSAHAPHWPYTTPPEYIHAYDDEPMAKAPSFDEEDVSDKPSWVRSLPRLATTCGDGTPPCPAQVEEMWRERQESLLAVDEMVGNLVAALEETDQAGRTYIVFASDNGFMLYRHRVSEKGAPYEESQGIPFVVRGPGVQQGVVSRKLVANIDLAPTIAQWAGIKPPSYVDGRSLVPLLEGTYSSWRKHLLFEYFGPYEDQPEHPYAAVRSNYAVYIEYPTGERELYDLSADPNQLKSLHADAEHQGLMDRMHARLEVLRTCAGDFCRKAEG